MNNQVPLSNPELERLGFVGRVEHHVGCLRINRVHGVPNHIVVKYMTVVGYHGCSYAAEMLVAVVVEEQVPAQGYLLRLVSPARRNVRVTVCLSWNRVIGCDAVERNHH